MNENVKNTLVTWNMIEEKVILSFALMTTGASSGNVGKLLSKLKLVPDNLLFIYAEANWEASEND